MKNKCIHLGTMVTTVLLLLFTGCKGGVDLELVAMDAPPVVRFVDVAFESGLRKKTISGGKEKRYIVEAKGGAAASFLDYDNDEDLDIYAVNGSTFEGFPPGEEQTDTLYRNNGDGTFTDVTQKAGVGDERWGMGCTAADYDNDGDQDIYVTNFGPNVLYRNNGDGTFTDVTQKAGVGDERWSTGCAFGDYDNDGYLDLYVANYVDFDINYQPPSKRFCQWRGIMTFYGPKGLKGAADVLYRNNGDGTFTDMTQKAGVEDKNEFYGFNVIFGDYDNDSDLDIYIVGTKIFRRCLPTTYRGGTAAFCGFCERFLTAYRCTKEHIPL